jgi:hypothetical protein
VLVAVQSQPFLSCDGCHHVQAVRKLECPASEHHRLLLKIIVPCQAVMRRSQTIARSPSPSLGDGFCVRRTPSLHRWTSPLRKSRVGDALLAKSSGPKSELDHASLSVQRHVVPFLAADPFSGTANLPRWAAASSLRGHSRSLDPILASVRLRSKVDISWLRAGRLAQPYP